MKTRYFKALIILFLTMFSGARLSWASDAQMMSMISQLQKDMAEMRKVIEMQNEKINALEGRSGSQIYGNTAVSDEDKAFNERLDRALGGNQKWLKDLKQWGDVRLRYDGIHYHSGNPNASSDRNRYRFRVRYGLEKKITKDLKAGFALASGETNGGVNSDPTSNNVSFDNNFGYKPIWIERAFMTYTPAFLASKWFLDKTEIGAGKVVNPFEKGTSEMIWDRDVKPEGVYEKMEFKLLDTDDLKLGSYLTAGQFVLDEDINVGGDANLFGYQFGLTPSFAVPGFEKPVDFLSAISFYDFSNYARKSNFIVNGTSQAKGNSNVDGVTTELDAGKFQVIDFYQELQVYPANIPTKFFFDWARNPADTADFGILHEDNAYSLGVKFGQVNKKGDWELGYQYRRVGANAVVGAFTDSDFGDAAIGAGKRGSLLRVGYGVTDAVTLSAAGFFVNNLNTGTPYVVDQEQDKLVVDLNVKF